MQSRKGTQIKKEADTLASTMKTIYFLSCLLYAATLTDGAMVTVEGFKGRSVSFQCPHRLAWANDKYFCKDPCKSMEDKLVTVNSGGTAESGRITLVDSGDGSFNVTFRHLQLSDSQKYWCAVDRPGFDTYTEIQLTVKEAVAVETVMPDVSSTWTDQSTNTAQLTGTGTIKPTKLSTALNFTPEEPKISKGTIVYAVLGGVALISILLLAVCFRKSRKTSKPTLEVYCNITDLSNAIHSEQVSCGYSNTDKRTKHGKELSERTSVSAHQHRRDPPTSEPTAASSIPLGIYENISLPKLPAGSGHSPTEDQSSYDNNSGTYMNTLPAII